MLGRSPTNIAAWEMEGPVRMHTLDSRSTHRRGYDASLDAFTFHSSGLPRSFGNDLAPPGAITGYAGPGKEKARLVCQAFVEGAGGGKVWQPAPRALVPGAAA